MITKFGQPYLSTRFLFSLGDEKYDHIEEGKLEFLLRNLFAVPCSS